eukprot:gene10445-2576_t
MKILAFFLVSYCILLSGTQATQPLRHRNVHYDHVKVLRSTTQYLENDLKPSLEEVFLAPKQGFASDHREEASQAQLQRLILDSKNVKFEEQRQRRADKCSTSSLDLDKIKVDGHTFPEDALEIAFVWIGQPRGEIVSMVTREIARQQPNLYCSRNYGRDYTLCDGIQAPIVAVHKVETRNSIWVFALPSPSESQYFSAEDWKASAGFYISTDNGRSFSFRRLDRHLESILPNPENAHEMLGFIQDDDHKEYSVDDVYHISAYGTSQAQMVLIEEHVFFADWATSDAAGSNDDVLLTIYRHEPGDVVPLDLIRIQYPGSREMKKTTLLSNCYDFHQDSNFLFATEVPSTDGFDERRLFVSKDNGNTFSTAQFPFAGRHNHFKVVDATEGVVFVLVQHTVTRTEGDTFVLRVNSPESISGNYTSSRALFTPAIESNVMDGVLFIENQNPTGCSDRGGVSRDSKGKIVVVQRGSCPFIEKTLNAQAVGAAAVIVVNTENYIDFRMAGESEEEVLIPAFIVTKSTGEKFETEFRKEGVDIQVSLIEENIEEKAIMETSNLFVSDETGVKYTLSLQDVAYVHYLSATGTEVADVHKIESQPGTYLATWLQNKRMETVITYNKGASWSLLPPPSNSRCDDLPENCNLHLALETSRALRNIPTPVSSPTAVGIILANGYVGVGMTYTSNEAFLVMSDDGGLTWKLVAEEPHEYQILDHGGILIAAPYFSLTKSILFSVDRGASDWKSKEITSSSTIIQLTSEPSMATLVVYAYFFEEKWQGAVIDFESLMSRPCTIGHLDSPDADYEFFSPGIPTGNDDEICLLGAHHKFLRRIDCRMCYNGLDHEPLFMQNEDMGSTTCECGAANFACAPGFVRQDSNLGHGECIYDKAYKKQIDCPSNKKHAKVNNYVKVVGDVCNGGIESEFQQQVMVPCSYSSRSRASVAIGVTITLVVLVTICAMVIYRSEVMRTRSFTLHTVIGLNQISKLHTEEPVTKNLQLLTKYYNVISFEICNFYSFSQVSNNSQYNDNLLESDDDELLIGTGDATPHAL